MINVLVKPNCVTGQVGLIAIPFDYLNSYVVDFTTVFSRIGPGLKSTWHLLL